MGDLGDAVGDRATFDAEPVSELGPESCVVDRRDRALAQLERAGVEGEPAVIWRSDPVGDDDVGVELWVEGLGGVLAKGRRDDALGVNDGDLAVDAVAGVGVRFDPLDGDAHGSVVRAEHVGLGVVVADGEDR